MPDCFFHVGRRSGPRSVFCSGLPGTRSRREPVWCAPHTVLLGSRQGRTDPDSAASGGSLPPSGHPAAGVLRTPHIPSKPSPASASLAYQPEAPMHGRMIIRPYPPSALGGPMADRGRACPASRLPQNGDCAPPVPRREPRAFIALQGASGEKGNSGESLMSPLVPPNASNALFRSITRLRWPGGGEFATTRSVGDLRCRRRYDHRRDLARISNRAANGGRGPQRLFPDHGLVICGSWPTGADNAVHNR